jgi:hypothetical protein
MSKTLRRLLRRPVRLDRSVEASCGSALPFDLELIQRGLKESLLVAQLFRRPVRYVRGRSRAPR